MEDAFAMFRLVSGIVVYGAIAYGVYWQVSSWLKGTRRPGYAFWMILGILLFGWSRL